MDRKRSLVFLLTFVFLPACANKASGDGTAKSTTSAESASTSASSSRATATTTGTASAANPASSAPKPPGWESAKECDEAGIPEASKDKFKEVKNTLGAIVRGSESAYEREQLSTQLLDGQQGNVLTHALCLSSVPSLDAVPKGTKELAKPAIFEKGDDSSGWRCLRFSLSDPSYFQYKYTKGSGYLGPVRGLPDPGPDGFEASAVGDLNGDGKTSLFTRVGVVNNVTHTVKVSKQLYCADPAE
jgi:hypothetical protein